MHVSLHLYTFGLKLDEFFILVLVIKIALISISFSVIESSFTPFTHGTFWEFARVFPIHLSEFNFSELFSQALQLLFFKVFIGDVLLSVIYVFKYRSWSELFRTGFHILWYLVLICVWSLTRVCVCVCVPLLWCFKCNFVRFYQCICMVYLLVHEKTCACLLMSMIFMPYKEA